MRKAASNPHAGFRSLQLVWTHTRCKHMLPLFACVPHARMPDAVDGPWFSGSLRVGVLPKDDIAIVEGFQKRVEECRKKASDERSDPVNPVCGSPLVR